MTQARTPQRKWWVDAALAVAARPWLWRVALVQCFSLLPRRSSAGIPRFSRGSRGWIAFRMETAYGDPSARPGARDVVQFLEWCRQSSRSAWRVR